MASYNQVVIDQNCQIASRLELENDHLPCEIFQWKPNHPLVDCKVKTTMRITTKQKIPTPQEEEDGKRYFLSSYLEVKEENGQRSEHKSPEWMDTEIKTKEVDISIDDISKLAKIGDYQTKEKTTKIVNLLK